MPKNTAPTKNKAPVKILRSKTATAQMRNQVFTPELRPPQRDNRAKRGYAYKEENGIETQRSTNSLVLDFPRRKSPVAWSIRESLPEAPICNLNLSVNHVNLAVLIIIHKRKYN